MDSFVFAIVSDELQVFIFYYFLSQTTFLTWQ